MSPLYHEGIPNTSGIYRITCTITGKIYVGSALNLRKRRKDHFGTLERNEHRNPKLQAAWNKYGSDAFTFEVLEYVLPISLTAREQYWFQKLQPFGKKGFNLDRVAGSSLGRVVSQASREKSRATQLGRIYPERHGIKKSPEAIENHRCALMGYKHTEETKRNMAESHKGSKRSPQTREKQRLAALGHVPTKVRDYIVTSPDGIEYEVHNLAEFCREHDLKATGMALAASGKRKQYKGWKARYA